MNVIAHLLVRSLGWSASLKTWIICWDFSIALFAGDYDWLNWRIGVPIWLEPIPHWCFQILETWAPSTGLWLNGSMVLFYLFFRSMDVIGVFNIFSRLLSSSCHGERYRIADLVSCTSNLFGHWSHVVCCYPCPYCWRTEVQKTLVTPKMVRHIFDHGVHCAPNPAFCTIWFGWSK